MLGNTLRQQLVSSTAAPGRVGGRAAVWLGSLILVLCLAAPATAEAGGTVLQIDGALVHVDLGSQDGVGAGTELVLLHVVTARDPVSGKSLRDRFPLGRLTVIKAGDRVALARAPKEIQHRIRVGDEVELASRKRAFSDPWRDTIAERKAERKAAATPRRRDPQQRQRQHALAVARANESIAQAESATRAWRATLGKSPAERVAIWQTYLDTHPRTPYAGEVRAEIASLQAQANELERLAEVAEPDDELAPGERARQRVERLIRVEPGIEPRDVLAGTQPDSVYQGSDIPLAFLILQPAVVDRAWIYFRSAGADSFRRLEMVRDGDAYLRTTLPGDVTTSAGVEYFIEVAAAENAPVAVLGTQGAPRRISVEAAVEDRPPDIEDRSRVTAFVDYVDFDGGFGDGFDQYVHAEIDFMYRFRQPVYSIRVGFGTLGGFGGPKDVIDESEGTCIDPDGVFRCQRVNYSYAYTELEYRFSDAFAVMLRPQFGSGSNDRRPDSDSGRCDTSDLEDCDLFNSIGLRARVRIGDELGTNLTLGVGVTQSVGTLFEAAYTWDVIPRFPIKLSAQVTDQPVPEDFGVRLIGDLGWRAVGWVYPSLRIAYQARDADHSGVSGGLAANFDW